MKVGENRFCLHHLITLINNSSDAKKLTKLICLYDFVKVKNCQLRLWFFNSSGNLKLIVVKPILGLFGYSHFRCKECHLCCHHYIISWKKNLLAEKLFREIESVVLETFQCDNRDNWNAKAPFVFSDQHLASAKVFERASLH